MIRNFLADQELEPYFVILFRIVRLDVFTLKMNNAVITELACCSFHKKRPFVYSMKLDSKSESNSGLKQISDLLE